MKFTCGRYSIEMFDEPTAPLASAGNVRAYDKEILLVRRESVWSRYGVVSFVDDTPVASIVVGAGAGPKVHDRSAILVEDLCIAAFDSELICLAVPTLEIRWQREADSFTCFGLHLIPGERAVVVHGELEISKWTFDGREVWNFSGADIFTGPFSIVGPTVVAEDFDKRVYRLDLRTGSPELNFA